MSFTTNASDSATSTASSARFEPTLSRTSSATSVDSAAPVTPLDAFPNPFDDACKSAPVAADIYLPDVHAYARALLPHGFALPTRAERRSGAHDPRVENPYSHCRSKADIAAVRALVDAHFAAQVAERRAGREERPQREGGPREPALSHTSSTTSIESTSPRTPLDASQISFDDACKPAPVAEAIHAPDAHAYARTLLPHGFALPTRAERRSGARNPCAENPYSCCRSSADVAAVRKLVDAHFAAQLADRRARAEEEREDAARRANEEHASKNAQMWCNAWDGLKAATIVTLSAGGVLCVLAFA